MPAVRSRSRPDPAQLAFALDLRTEEADPGSAPAQESAPTSAGPLPGTERADAVPSSEAEQTPEPEGAADGEGEWRAILDFEREWTGPSAVKPLAVRARFGISSARYHQQLDRALERPDALAYDPTLVARLRRVREARRRKRFARRVETG